jgi:hypothetical protein
MTRHSYLAMAILLFGVCGVHGQDAKGEFPQQRFVGDWVNVDNATRGTKRLAISKEGESWFIQTWGSGMKDGKPEIPHTKVSLFLLGDSVTGKSLPYGFASWDNGFADRHLTLRLDNEQLIVEHFTLFKDQSKRSNYRSVMKFQKK